MEKVAEGLYLLKGFPKYSINIYLMEDVLVDAGTAFSKNRILKELKGRQVTAHALTHGHPDHQGASKAVCKALSIPLWCGEKDAAAVTSGNIAELIPDNFIIRLQLKFWASPGHPVDRILREGDEVAGFTVLDTPGHSPGHVAYWREADRVLIAGDVLFNAHPVTGQVGLRQPPEIFTVNPAQNRQSILKLAALEPNVVCFGHGPPLRDTKTLLRFADSLK